jgi:hypothetical protein
MEEEKELKFHPEINSLSKKLAMKSNEPIEDRLIKYGNEKNKKNIKEQNYKQIKEQENNTFQPKIPESSKKLGLKKKKMRLEQIRLNIPEKNPSYLKLDKNQSNDNSLIKNDNKEDNNSNNDSSINICNINNNELKNSYSISVTKSQEYDKSKTQNDFSRYNSDKTSFIYHNKIKKVELNPEKNLYDYLYLESKIIKDKKDKKIEENMKKNYPFKPTISKKNNELIKNKNETKEDFINRMAMNKNQYEEIQSLIDKKKNKNNNSNNSQKLFQPSITRGPKNPSQRQFSVNEEGDYDKKLNKENNELFNKEISNAMTKRNLYLKNSMEIIIKKKTEKIQTIFNLLDSDNDGFISSEKIKLSNLNQQTLVLLTPLLEELQSNKDNMTFKEFYEKAEPLLCKIFS